jgi:hypothetical protein
MHRSARWVIVAIAICSWLAITNHCAFAALGPKTDSVRSECPFHSKPPKQKEQSSQIQCCKILRAVVLEKAKNWARNDAKFSDINLWVQEFALIALLRSALVPLFLDTGPPAAYSFAELILQRSLLVHAPPSLS